MSSVLSRRAIVTSSVASAVLVGTGVSTSGASAHSSDRLPAPYPVKGHRLRAAGPGQKWDIDGNAQRFRGNTFVAQIPQNSPFFAAQKEALAQMARSKFRLHYSRLPHNSLHMTVFEMVNQNHIINGTWPTWLGSPDTVPPTSVKILQRLQQVHTKLDVPRDVTMRVTGMSDFSTSFQVYFSGVNDKTELSLRTFRRQLSEELEIAIPSRDTYQFHSTLGYRLVDPLKHELADQEALRRRIGSLFRGRARTVTLEPFAFTLFDDMLAFPQLYVL